MRKTGKNLLELNLNDMGVIQRVEGNSGEKQRFFELGFVPGTPITYRMNTAFSDPRIYQLRGATLALRLSDAKKIFIAS